MVDSIKYTFIFNLVLGVLFLNALEGQERKKTNNLISSGDTLLMNINGEPQISGQFLVSIDGDISHSLLGKIEAEGKGPNDFAEEIVGLLQDGYILKPGVSVSIIDQKPYLVRMIGEVTKPGEIQFPRNKPLDLGSAVGLVGNLTEQADKNAIKLNRGGKITKINISSLSTVMLKDGDVISVGKLPELGTFSISGEIMKAGTYMIPREKEKKLTIFAAISMAGGPSKVAKLSKTIVTRTDSAGRTNSTTIDASDRSKIFLVRPGDEIEVKARIF